MPLFQTMQFHYSRPSLVATFTDKVPTPVRYTSWLQSLDCKGMLKVHWYHTLIAHIATTIYRGDRPIARISQRWVQNWWSRWPLKQGSGGAVSRHCEYLSVSADAIDLKLNLFTDVSNDMCITNIIDYEAINT